MPLRDITQHHSHGLSLAPNGYASAPQIGSAADLAGYGAAVVIITLGSFNGTASPTATFDIQDSPDNVTFTSVPANLLVGGALPVVTPAMAMSIMARGYIGLNRYLRVALTALTGTSPTCRASATILQGEAQIQPTASTL